MPVRRIRNTLACTPVTMIQYRPMLYCWRTPGKSIQLEVACINKEAASRVYRAERRWLFSGFFAQAAMQRSLPSYYYRASLIHMRLSHGRPLTSHNIPLSTIRIRPSAVDPFFTWRRCEMNDE